MPSVVIPVTRNQTWRSVLFGGSGSHGITSDFWSSSSRRSGSHTGVDLAASYGTTVHAPIGGKVVRAGWDGAFGNTVLVRMPNGDYLFFAHLSKIGVKAGDRLKNGSYIGRVGSTGNSSGPHLHLEVRSKSSGGRFGSRESWRFYDPIKYLNSNAGRAVSASNGNPYTEARKSLLKEFEAAADTSSPSSSSSTGSTTTTTGGDMPEVSFTKQDFYDALSSMFGSIDILMKLDKKARGELGGKSIKWAVDSIVKKKITDPSRALTILNKTAWFKKYGIETTKRLVEEKQRPGVAKSSIEQMRERLAASLRDEGVNVNDKTLNKLARNAWVYGWSEEQAFADLRASGKFDASETQTRIKEMLERQGVVVTPKVLDRLSDKAWKLGWSDDTLISEIQDLTSGVDVSLAADRVEAMLNDLGVQLTPGLLKQLAHDAWAYSWSDETLIDQIQALKSGVSYSGGRIAAGVDELTSFADDYGVGLSDADVRQFRTDFLDNKGIQNAKDRLQERAAQTYGVFADKIRSGQSVRALAGAYFQHAANMLEVDPNDIAWDDPLFSGGRAFTTVDPKTGQQVQKGLWDFEKDIRKDSRWLGTANARNEMMATTGGILQMMGLV